MPKEIVVGYQKRRDTYTGRLAYVVYKDIVSNKEIIRKETSWNNWRDKEIEANSYENKPMSGFVLNKKAGGYNSGWNHRQTYIRVYDPRGHEFEITVANLLYILENTNSIKGKGLEGEFVYGWDGKDLLLIPVDSPDYKEIVEFNNKLNNKKSIKGKDLITGAIYRTKSNDEIIYIGKYKTYNYSGVSKGNAYWFCKNNSLEFVSYKSLSGLIEVVEDICVSNYSDLYDKLQNKYEISPIDKSRDEYIEYSIEELRESTDNNHYKSCYIDRRPCYIIRYNKNYELVYDNVYVTKERFIKGYNGEIVRTIQEKERKRIKYDTIEELFEDNKIYYLRKYLQNNRIYSESR